jgi:hypothetical protein
MLHRLSRLPDDWVRLAADPERADSPALAGVVGAMLAATPTRRLGATPSLSAPARAPVIPGPAPRAAAERRNIPVFQQAEKVVLIAAASRGTTGAIAPPALGQGAATVVLGTGRLDRQGPTVSEIEANGGTACANTFDLASRQELAAFAAAIATLDDEEPTWEDAEWQ